MGFEWIMRLYIIYYYKKKKKAKDIRVVDCSLDIIQRKELGKDNENRVWIAGEVAILKEIRVNLNIKVKKEMILVNGSWTQMQVKMENLNMHEMDEVGSKSGE